MASLMKPDLDWRRTLFNEKGDLILKEIESSIIGYRAQQLRPLAVH